MSVWISHRIKGKDSLQWDFNLDSWSKSGPKKSAGLLLIVNILHVWFKYGFISKSFFSDNVKVKQAKRILGKGTRRRSKRRRRTPVLEALEQEVFFNYCIFAIDATGIPLCNDYPEVPLFLLPLTCSTCKSIIFYC